MNERIRELAVQAGMALKPRRLYDDNEPDGYLESDLDYLDNNLEATRVFFEGGLEKFAELIVRECATVILNNDIEKQEDYGVNHLFFNGWERGVIDSCHAIKEHFGVEE